MLTSSVIGDNECILIESDNCSSQYESARYFHDIQQIANLYKMKFFKFAELQDMGKGSCW